MRRAKSKERNFSKYIRTGEKHCCPSKILKSKLTFPLLCFIKSRPQLAKNSLKVIREQSIIDWIFQYLFVIFFFSSFLKMDLFPASLLSFLRIPVPCALTYAQRDISKSHSGSGNSEERSSKRQCLQPWFPPGAYFFYLFSFFLSFLNFGHVAQFARYFSFQIRD